MVFFTALMAIGVVAAGRLHSGGGDFASPDANHCLTAEQHLVHYQEVQHSFLSANCRQVTARHPVKTVITPVTGRLSHGYPLPHWEPPDRG